MFIGFNGTIYVADPGDKKAKEILEYQKHRLLRPRYRAVVLVVAGLGIVAGVLSASRGLFLVPTSTISTLGSLTAFALLIFAGLILGWAVKTSRMSVKTLTSKPS